MVLRVLVVFGALLGVPVMAQDNAVVRETRCWLGSVTFSSGALMDTGSGVMACVADRGWVAQDGEAGDAAGCLLDGDISSVGAVIGISNNDRQWLQCEANGRWTVIESGAAAE